MKHLNCTPQNHTGYQKQGKSQGFSSGLVVRTLLSTQTQIQSLVKELRFHKPHSEAKTKQGNSEKLSWPRGS